MHKNYWDQQQENYKIKENGFINITTKTNKPLSRASDISSIESEATSSSSFHSAELTLSHYEPAMESLTKLNFKKALKPENG